MGQVVAVACCECGREGHDEKSLRPERPDRMQWPESRLEAESQRRKIKERHSLARDVKLRVAHRGVAAMQTEPLEKFYSLTYLRKRQTLGVGSSGTVIRATERSTGACRAVKTIHKAHFNKDIQREIDLMTVLDHPHIVKLFETYEDRHSVYLVMELCSGSELFDKLGFNCGFGEANSAIVMRQLLSACLYMHKAHYIVHRDLKPENILFEMQEGVKGNCLKLIGFGASKRCPPGTRLTTKVGTPVYLAPEVWKGQSYDEAVDLWSCGVVLYRLLCGRAPFSDQLERDHVISEKVVSGNVDTTSEGWYQISEEAKQLVRKLLCQDAKARYTAQQALDDVWIRERTSAASKLRLKSLLEALKLASAESKTIDTMSNVYEARVSGNIVDNLRSFRLQHRLKKAALHVVASELARENVEGLRNLFESLDADGDGLLTLRELKAGMAQGGLADAGDDLCQIFLEVDSQDSGAIDYRKFLAATLDRKVYMQEDVCWAAFQVFDTNGDGKISPEALHQVFLDGSKTESRGGDLVKSLMSEVDMNNDGFIDFDEFTAMMRSQGTSRHSVKC